MKTLTLADYARAVQILDCEIAAIMAVALVESSGNGFNSDGSLKKRFEAHWFKRLSGKTASTYSEAYALDPTNAMKATSWGKFQIMGFNYQTAGFSSIAAFVDAMQKSEKEHLAAFCSFIERLGYIPLLQAKNWTEFAKKYNGSHWQENKYDEKLVTAYNDAVKNGWQG